MGNTCSAGTLESLNMIVPKIEGGKGGASPPNVLQTISQLLYKICSENLTGSTKPIPKTNRQFLGIAFLKKGLYLATKIYQEKVKMHMIPHHHHPASLPSTLT